MTKQAGKPTRCDRCNVETTQPEILKKVPRSFRTDFHYYCPRCVAELATHGRRRHLWTCAFMLMGGILLTYFSPKLDLGWLLLNGAWLQVCLALTVIPHELAHAFAARALGLRVFRIFIGSGSTWWRGSLFGFDVEARTSPFDGVVLAASRDGQGVRWRLFLFTAAGLLANAVFFLVARLAYGPLLENVHFTSAFVGWPMIALANLLVLAGNLWPHHVQTSMGLLPSDGLQMLHILLGRNQRSAQEHRADWFLLESHFCYESLHNDEARAWIERGLAEYPQSVPLLSQKAQILLNAGELEAARATALGIPTDGSPADAKNVNVTNHLAYVNALLGTHELLEEADHYSVENLAAYPWSAAVRDTRGVVLLALGRSGEALPHLRESATQFQNRPDNAAQSYSSLAIAEAREGNIAEAECALETARLAAPDCFLIPRAEEALRLAREQAAAQAV